VQEIKYWITLRRGLIRGSRVITCGQVYAVVDNILQNLAMQRIAINATLCVRDRSKI
jgi:hypothetical protein